MNRILVNVGLGLTVAVGLLSLSSCGTPRSASAKALLIAAEQTNGAIKPQVSASTVTYIVRHVIERQLGSTLADPYHLPVSEYSRYKEEVWITESDVSLQTRMKKTNEQGSLLFDTQSVKTGDSVTVRTNDRVKGVDVVAETTVAKAQTDQNPNTQGRWFENSADRDFRVSEVAESDWERGAWKIELEKDVVNGGPSYLPDVDRAADLEATKLRYVWVIDKDSSMAVNTESLAITNRGEVLLGQTKVEPPKMLDRSTLPDDWFVIPAGRTTSNADSQSSVGTANAGQTAKVLYAPAPATLALLRLEPFAPAANIQLGADSSSGVFDILTATNNGLAAMSVFRSMDSDSKYITLIQGPAGPLVNGLKSRAPDWEKSERLSLTVDGVNVTDAWLAYGGILSAKPSRKVVIFEHDDFLFYVIGQSVQTDELISFISSLTKTATK